MPKLGQRGVVVEGRKVPTKIRKRGCSSSSSTSSRIHNHRLSKRVILVGKNRSGLVVGIGGSRSSTPVPTWKTTPLRSAIDSPKFSLSAKSTRPVSARRLAATLWGMNEMPSPRLSESNLELVEEQPKKKNGNKMASKREKMQAGWGLHSGSGPLPPHLSDPSHSPTVTEKMDRSGTGSHRRRTPSISQRLRSADHNVRASDSTGDASFMEVETRSRVLTSSGSVSGGRNRLQDASNALTTSKELLKIINRIWARADQPSSSMSIVSALHAELERARLEVNHFIQEYRSEKKEISFLIKCFSEEKTSWKSKEHQAIESIAGELEIERKSRHRLESLNKKLGQEIAEMKSSLVKAVKELECEKRAREITEQVCEELARNINDDRAEAEMLKRESVKVQEEVERGRDRIEFSDKSCQTKLSDAKNQVPGKNSALNKLRKQLEGFLGAKRDKRVENVAYLSKSNEVLRRNETEHAGEVDDLIESKEDSTESDLHSIEITSDNNANKGYKCTALASAAGRDFLKQPAHDEIRSRNSVPEQVSRRTTSIQTSRSGGVEWGIQDSSYPNSGDGVDRAKFLLEEEAQRRSYLDEARGHKTFRALKDHALSSSKSSPLSRECHRPSRQRDQSLYLQDQCRTFQERPRQSSSAIQATNLKLRIADARGENQSERRSKR